MFDKNIIPSIIILQPTPLQSEIPRSKPKEPVDEQWRKEYVIEDPEPRSKANGRYDPFSDPIKRSLIDTLNHINSAYNVTMMMYLATFASGIILLFTSVALYWYKGQSIMTGVFIGISVLTILAFFIRDPIRELKKSKCDLAQLQTCLYHWFIDLYNWDGYIQYLHDNQAIDFDNMKKISEAMYQNTAVTVKVIQRYADECEVKPPK